MNLTNHPWIPIIREDHSTERLSLKDLFSHADEILDLDLDPPARIAVMRFLICICQAALDGPEDESQWLGCRSQIQKAALEYLDRLADRFELYDENRPFLQIPGLTVETGKEEKAVKPLGAIDFKSPYGGSNTPLFDHPGILGLPPAAEEDLPLFLLTVLNFSTGGKVGQAKWDNIQSNASTFAAPCIKSLHTFLQGESMLDTLHWNLMCKKGGPCGVDQLPNGSWGKPVWEKIPHSPEDSSAWMNAFDTYLGRLVPLTRLVNLFTFPGQCIFGPLPNNLKMNHLPMYREPSTTVVLNKKQEPYYFSVSSSRHVWRDLESILALGQNGLGTSGALAIKRLHLQGHRVDNQNVNIWTGGLETGATAAKLSDMVEWQLTLPMDLLQDEVLEIYTKGVELAQTGESLLRKGVKIWADDQKLSTIPWPKGQALYWATLDTRWTCLLEAVDKERPLAEVWYPEVRNAMETSYTRSCAHTSARQLRAFAKGRDKLRLKKPQI